MNTPPNAWSNRPSSPIPCKLEYHSNSERLTQLYAGLCDLHRMGWIRLSQSFVPLNLPDLRKPPHLAHAQLEHAALEFGGQRLYFDLHDSQELDRDALSRCDFYFKRSFAVNSSPSPTTSPRVLPYGLNYPVESSGFDKFAISRHWRFHSGLLRIREFWRHFPVGRQRSLASHRFESEPSTLPPKVLFMTRLWDPDDNPNRTPEKRAHFRELNELRATCVRALRRELGPNFYGGVADTAHARKWYPDAIIQTPADASKWRYLQLVRKHPICITTNGLHDSIGWKMGEYVAMSRAIISERLANAVPGVFAAGCHYLPFDTLQECLHAVETLVRDPQRRMSLMGACHNYYSEALRPDRLIWNALERTLPALGSDLASS